MKKGAVYIVSAVRTPIGKFGGGLAEFTGPDLGVIAVRAALERAFGAPLPAEREPGAGGAMEDSIKNAQNGSSSLKREEIRWHVDELIFGNARPAGVGPNPARQIAWRSGLGDDVPAYTREHGVRFGAARDSAWLAADSAGRSANDCRRRRGIDVQSSVPGRRALGREDGQSTASSTQCIATDFCAPFRR